MQTQLGDRDYKITTWHHVRAGLALPGVVVILIPTILLLTLRPDTLSIWNSRLAITLTAFPGSLLFLAGTVLTVSSIRLFVTHGDGTLAPWEPTQEFVVAGLYRHVRNPMILGVFCMLLGEALISASLPVLLWFLIFTVANMIYIPRYEEPELRRKFGTRYQRYCDHVRRWIPRLRPWEQSSDYTYDFSALPDLGSGSSGIGPMVTPVEGEESADESEKRTTS